MKLSNLAYWPLWVIKKVLIVSLISLRPILGPPASCYFYPSCTQYAYQQLCTQPLLIAFRNTAYQLAHCHPFARYISSLASWLSSERSECSKKTEPKIG